MGEARILTPPRCDKVPRGQRNLVELEGHRIGRRRERLARRLPHRKARNLAQRSSRLEGVRDPRHGPLAIVENHGIDWILQERMWIRCRGVAADDDGHAWRELSNLTGQCHDVVGFERVHGRDADQAQRRKTSRSELLVERAGESQIGDGRRVASGFERRGDVLHAEGLDAKERAEAEPVVPGYWTQQEYVHGSAVKRNIEARARRPKDARLSSPIPIILSWSRRHRAMVLLAGACLAAASIALMRGLSFDTDVLSLLPRAGRIVPAFRTYVSSFGSVDDLYVVLTAPPGHEISEYEVSSTSGHGASRKRRRSAVWIPAALTTRAI